MTKMKSYNLLKKALKDKFGKYDVIFHFKDKSSFSIDLNKNIIDPTIYNTKLNSIKNDINANYYEIKKK